MAYAKKTDKKTGSKGGGMGKRRMRKGASKKRGGASKIGGRKSGR